VKMKGRLIVSKKTIKLKHFGNTSMHIENYITECFIGITKNLNWKVWRKLNWFSSNVK